MGPENSFFVEPETDPCPSGKSILINLGRLNLLIYNEKSIAWIWDNPAGITFALWRHHCFSHIGVGMGHLFILPKEVYISFVYPYLFFF
jgi:hypothetical protein